MKKQFNEETKKHEWILSTWYDKTLFVLGWVSFVYMALYFIAGMVIGILGL